MGLEPSPPTPASLGLGFLPAPVGPARWGGVRRTAGVLTPGHVDRGEPAVEGLLPGVWVEATLGEVDVDVDGAILLDALQECVTWCISGSELSLRAPVRLSSHHLCPPLCLCLSPAISQDGDYSQPHLLQMRKPKRAATCLRPQGESQGRSEASVGAPCRTWIYLSPSLPSLLSPPLRSSCFIYFYCFNIWGRGAGREGGVLSWLRRLAPSRATNS